MERVIGLGAGGHAKVVIEILRLAGGYELVGLLDPDRRLWTTKVEGLPVLGDDELLRGLLSEGVQSAFLGLGAVGDTKHRQALFEMAAGLGFRMVQAVHPQAIISPTAHLGAGVTVMAGAIINPSAEIGDNVIVNTGAIVEHDCRIGAHAHVAPGARLSGNVSVGDGAHVGVGCSVRENITVGNRAIVAAGAAVVSDVADGVVVAGVPARVIRNV